MSDPAAAVRGEPQLRRRRPGWHRKAGRVLVVAGLGVATSALWLNQFFPRAGATREVRYPLRMAVGTALVISRVAAWAINPAVAERTIRQPKRRRPATAPARLALP